MSFQFAIDLPFRDDWANVDVLRSSVQNCLTTVFGHIDGCHTVATVVGELLENAIKYGTWRQDGPFRLSVSGESDAVRVRVENPIDPDAPHAAKLLGTIRWIDEHESAEAAYRAKLLETAQSPEQAGVSGLGLVRVAYEGDCSLKVEQTDGGVAVLAELKV